MRGTFTNGKYDKWLNMCISTPLCLQTPWSYLHTTVNTCRNNIVKKKLKMFWKGIFQGNIHLIPTVYQTKLWLNMCIGTLCLPAPWRRSLPPLATTTVTKKPKLFKSFSGLHPLQWGYMHESPVPQTKTALKSVSVFGSEDQFKLVIQQIKTGHLKKRQIPNQFFCLMKCLISNQIFSGILPLHIFVKNH